MSCCYFFISRSLSMYSWKTVQNASSQYQVAVMFGFPELPGGSHGLYSTSTPDIQTSNASKPIVFNSIATVSASGVLLQVWNLSPVCTQTTQGTQKSSTLWTDGERSILSRRFHPRVDLDPREDPVCRIDWLWARVSRICSCRCFIGGTTGNCPSSHSEPRSICERVDSSTSNREFSNGCMG